MKLQNRDQSKVNPQKEIVILVMEPVLNAFPWSAAVWWFNLPPRPVLVICSPLYCQCVSTVCVRKSWDLINNSLGFIPLSGLMLMRTLQDYIKPPPSISSPPVYSHEGSDERWSQHRLRGHGQLHAAFGAEGLLWLHRKLLSSQWEKRETTMVETVHSK